MRLCFCYYLAGAVVRSPHKPGINPIADELIQQFGDFSFSADDEDASHSDSANPGIQLQPSDAAVDFRDRVGAILKNNGNSFASTEETAAAGGGGGTVADDSYASFGVPAEVSVKGRSGKAPKVLGGTLDKDLRQYFVQEDQTRHLSNLGFFERDTFMDFE